MQLNVKMLEEIQKNNLHFLEEWSDSLPRVAGVDIVRCLAYDLIQILNNVVLSDNENKDDTNIE